MNKFGKFVLCVCYFALSTSLAGCGGGAANNAATPSATSPAPAPAPAPTPVDLPVPPAAPAGDNFHPDFEGWKLIWSDEFEGAELDRTKWEVEISCWGGGNDERQCYTDRTRNVEIVNGLLRLKAYPEDFTGPQYPQGWPSGPGPQITQSYTSGKVRTRELADWKYGRFEARIKLPSGQGTWPAFWMLPADFVYGDWPLSGEIDIMEAVNLGASCSDCEGNWGENRSSGALHFGDPWPNNTFITDKITLLGDAEAKDQYHVFAVEWGEGRLNWFVDGVKYMTINQDQWFTAGQPKAENANAPFDQAFYLMFNLAVGGGLSENNNERGLDASSFPTEMLVDWVRVYECDFDELVGRSCMDGE